MYAVPLAPFERVSGSATSRMCTFSWLPLVGWRLRYTLMPARFLDRERGREEKKGRRKARLRENFGKRIRFQPGSVYLALALCSSNRPLQLTSLPTTSLHERGRERSHPCPEPEGGEPQEGASLAKQFTALLGRP